jgi:Leucine-rich repeat (LRR) protein
LVINSPALDVSQNTALTELYCYSNQLTSLDVSGATALYYLACHQNQLTSLNVSQNTALIVLICSDNQLTSLNVSQNTALTILYCYENQLTSLDVSQNTALTYLDCRENQLTSLDVRNGNNTNFTDFYANNNPNLYCIDVDDDAFSTFNWTGSNFGFDSQSYFSNNCSGTTEVEEQITNKELLKVTDLLGRETKATNQLLFYIYNDGTVEKKVVVE